MTPGDVLLTGATGFVGMELLARYLERGDRRVVTLVRAPDDRAAQARVDGVLANLFGARAGGYRRSGLGARRRSDRAGARAHPRVARAAGRAGDHDCPQRRLGVVRRCPLDEARAINVEGTRPHARVRRVAREASGGLDRYAHISTAYVAGDHAGRFAERDLDLGQTFHNSYERSKFEAEQLVRTRAGLPSTILRPSIVVGDRRSGWTSAFNVLYWPLRAFARGLFTAVPAIPTAPVDVVSVDYVADAIHALCESNAGIGETYHLTAGRGCEHDRRDRRSSPAATSGGRCRRSCRPRSSPRGAAVRSSTRRWTRAASTSPTSRSTRCLTGRPRGRCWSRRGSGCRRCASTWSGCWTSPPRSRWGKRPIAGSMRCDVALVTEV